MSPISQEATPSHDSAFVEYFHLHVGAAHMAASRRIGIDQADDVLADAFTLAWQKQAHLFDSSRGRAWLLTTVAYLCMNVQRAANRERSKNFEAGILTQVSNARSDPENADFWDAWDLLTPYDQDLLSSVYWDDIPYSDLVKLHNTTQGALRTRVSRAKSRLARLLTPRTSRSPREAHVE